MILDREWIYDISNVSKFFMKTAEIIYAIGTYACTSLSGFNDTELQNNW